VIEEIDLGYRQLDSEFCTNKSTILLNYIQDNYVELFSCEYCKGIRNDPKLYEEAL
jgi:hypothetical protein